eukprot:TRINITY_DN102486_c0_g1_i1.p1 TRINITY_DN102486_c0_g1~~TRINITY_DN102486_c0_g1_i1.p1  ORF type:complete len:199 (+),score=21.81 TRINITY_DN102486_c0_g1_i1:93-689(+)
MGCCESCHRVDTGTETGYGLVDHGSASPLMAADSSGCADSKRPPAPSPRHHHQKPVSQPKPSRPSSGVAATAIAPPSGGIMVAPTRQHSAEVFRLQYRELSPDDYELLCLLDEAVPNRSTTPASLVTQLPRMPASDSGTAECLICLSKFKPSDAATHLPCGHAFHQDCASKWLTQCKGTCPVCMEPVVPRSPCQDRPA